MAWGDRRRSHYVFRTEQRQNEPTLFLSLPSLSRQYNHTHTHNEKAAEEEETGDGNKEETD